jgi:hypothetical protein
VHRGNRGEAVAGVDDLAAIKRFVEAA